MFRKDLIGLLLHHPASLHELSEMLQEPVKDVEADLQHLLKSLRHQPYRVRITPARCHKCDFVFSRDKLHKPSKCPRCKGTWISEPRIAIEEKA
jgi:predicted Zn-ribbon and HTH transcriptional regulator